MSTGIMSTGIVTNHVQVQYGDSALEQQHKVMDGPGLTQGLEASKKRRALMDVMMPLRVNDSTHTPRPGVVLRSVTVYSGKMVNKISCVETDGATTTVGIGSGPKIDTFTLDPGCAIVEFSVYLRDPTDEGGRAVEAIEFMTSSGMLLGPYGANGGDPVGVEVMNKAPEGKQQVESMVGTTRKWNGEYVLGGELQAIWV